ncbi:ribonuclease BN [Novosphingobium sp. PC22D]|nr:ribonuclease BN [Novosphingobium sp. PC22D]
MTPEGRRREALRGHEGLQARLLATAGPGTRAFTVVRRIWTGAWNDGFIHAGNLAYMTLLALFPFFIAVAAIFSVIGEQGQLDASIGAVLTSFPPRVAEVVGPVARDIAAARQGWLLWVGGLFGVWTATSLIETIRDILHRAYGTPETHAFWHYRLVSTGVIFAAVLLLLVSLSGQVLLSAVQEVVRALFPGLNPLFDEFVFTRLVSAGALFFSIYFLFVSLTPSRYQARRYPKWPGAALVTVWWLVVTFAMPRVLRTFFTYDLTYGSLAGVMIALFFFWLVGLGMVVGAELNAALAVSPEEQEMLARATGGTKSVDVTTQE